MGRGFGNILPSPAKVLRGRSKRSDASQSSMVMMNDNATLYSLEGQQSIAAMTVHSQVTIKASNKHGKPTSKSTTDVGKSKRQSSSGWQKFKRLVGAKSNDGTPTKNNSKPKSDSVLQADSLTSGYPLQRRAMSVDTYSRQRSDNSANRGGSDVGSGSRRYNSNERRHLLDLAIRGRLDGIDILSLGSVDKSLISRKITAVKDKENETNQEAEVEETKEEITDQKPAEEDNSKEEEDNSKEEEEDPANFEFDPLALTFTDRTNTVTAADIVSDMVVASAGKDQVELILEGYIPGGSDRWYVRLIEQDCQFESLSSCGGSHCSTPKKPAEDIDDESTAVLTDDDGSANLPTHKLWDNMWGEESPRPPLPAHMQIGHDEEPDDFMELAEACSVPIDLDEDTFMISTAEHFRSVHGLAMIPMQNRRFDSALAIFDKLLKGLEGNADKKLEHLTGCTHHNIGMIDMCQGNYGLARESFARAVELRKKCLPQNHPDIIVSIVREGTCFLALDCIHMAIELFETALQMSLAEDSTRAKIFNNLGVAQYQLQDYAAALKSFTSALEIQRQWLDGPVRRESIVYDASVTLGNMGKVYVELCEYEASYFVFEESCLLQTSAFRKDHKIVLNNLNNMALLHSKSEKYPKSIQILKSILRSQESRFGKDSSECIQTRGLLGYMCMMAFNFDESLDNLEAVLDWQLNCLPQSHPAVKTTEKLLEKLKEMTKKKVPMWI